MVILGKDASFKWNTVALADIESIDFNGAEFIEEDTTAMGDGAVENTPTVQNPQVTVVCKRNTADTTGQNALITDSNAKTPHAVVVMEDATGGWTWNGRAKYKIAANSKGIVMLTITVNGTSDGAIATYS